MTDFIPLPDTDAITQLSIALRLHVDRLPQMKGKGAIVGADARDRAIKILAEAVFASLKQSNLIFGRDREKYAQCGTSPNQGAAGSKGFDDDTVAIPCGPLPREPK